MDRKDLITQCHTFADVYEDYPFGDEWAVIRHQENKKIFAWIYERGGQLYINLKCEPMKAEFWRRVYEDVTPGFHMNKTHWNTLVAGGRYSQEDFFEMLADSYRLTAPKRKHHQNSGMAD